MTDTEGFVILFSLLLYMFDFFSIIKKFFYVIPWIRAMKVKRKYSDLRYILDVEQTGAMGRLNMEIEGKQKSRKIRFFWLDKMRRASETEKTEKSGWGGQWGVGRELRILF